MPNCLPYGSNRLFLFWMLTKLRKLGFQTNLITTQKTVENYVDKIVVTATMNSRKPTMTTLASEYSEELCRRILLLTPQKNVETDYSQTYPHIESCGPPLRGHRWSGRTDSLTRQLSCPSAATRAIILMGEIQPFM